MSIAEDKTKTLGTIHAVASGARALANNAGILMKDAYKKARKAILHTGEKVKDAAHKIEHDA